MNLIPISFAWQQQFCLEKFILYLPFVLLVSFFCFHVIALCNLCVGSSFLAVYLGLSSFWLAVFKMQGKVMFVDVKISLWFMATVLCIRHPFPLTLCYGSTTGP